jgi:hypothetical protein
MSGREAGGVEVPMGLGLKGLKNKEKKNERVCDPEGGPLGARGPRKSSFPDPEVSAICWAFLDISQMGSFAIPGHNKISYFNDY